GRRPCRGSSALDAARHRHAGRVGPASVPHPDRSGGPRRVPSGLAPPVRMGDRVAEDRRRTGRAGGRVGETANGMVDGQADAGGGTARDPSRAAWVWWFLLEGGGVARQV
ncbi:MAG: hypothetical protein AVDCRST_MAG49-805, partial [uncultured Thermomicrobiales bacterium]